RRALPVAHRDNRRCGVITVDAPHQRTIVDHMHSYRITDAARLLGVSDDTVRRWIDRGILPTTGASPIEVPGDALAAHALELARSGDDPSDVPSSARNRLPGLVTRVRADGVLAQVAIQAGPHRVVSLISGEAGDEVGV